MKRRKTTTILLLLLLTLCSFQLSGQSVFIKQSDGKLNSIKMEYVSSIYFPFDAYNKVYVCFIDNSRLMYLSPEVIWFEGGFTSNKEIKSDSNNDIMDYYNGKLVIRRNNLSEKDNVYIYDISGRMQKFIVFDNEGLQTEIDLSFLPRGIYIVKTGKFVKKIII